MTKVNYLNVLKWPIITYVIGFIVFVVGSIVAPGIEKLFPADGDFILDLVFGAWVGYKMVQMGGKYYDGIIGGVILGIVLGVVEVVFLAMSPMMEIDLASGFVFALVIGIVGALIGAGYASTK